ncbi:hypothetical protein [Paenibacillus sp. QZ-Y1]|uniref:hypothetical protein n=1 Tax=Paenibacillus sp. QZ-Y1 TaxID=3414511 RepID=UPI003F79B5A9
MKNEFLKDVEKEAERRVREMGVNWGADGFTPLHSYPYVYMQVFMEKAKDHEM